eukprot:UN26796
MRSAAEVSGCDAVGVDLQQDQVEVANQLNARCIGSHGEVMSERCHVVQGDFLKMDLSPWTLTGKHIPPPDSTYDQENLGRGQIIAPDGTYDSAEKSMKLVTSHEYENKYDHQFDAMMSLLVVLHIPKDQRVDLFQRVHSVLKPGAIIYLEDFVEAKLFCD